jgi:hypothetical protein
VAVRVGAKSQSVEKVDDNGLAHRPLPELPAEKKNETLDALVPIRRLLPDRTQNVARVF